MAMNEWGFYGRQEEIRNVMDILDHSGFFPVYIEGRRGVGKSELMEEAIRRGGGDGRAVIFELLPEHLESAAQRNGRFVRQAMDVLPPDLAKGMGDPVQDDSLSYMRFSGLMARAIERGARIIIDEFHLAKQLGLEGPLKMMIDRFKSIGTPSPAGNLLVMGSHQQRLLRMFGSDQPLFQRIRYSMSLKQWTPSEVLEMAEDQGLLKHPGRFLSLWTAFGGIPRYWNDFMTGRDAAQLRGMDGWNSDAEWRHAFLEQQETLLSPSSDYRTDNRAYIELGEKEKDILQWLSEHHPQGILERRLADAMKAHGHGDIDRSLTLLSGYLQLIGFYGAFWHETEDPNVRIEDRSTLFQRAVFPDMFMTERQRWKTAQGPERGKASDFRMARLETLEGSALESFTSSWLAEQPGVTWAGHRNWRRTPESRTGMSEVDVMALEGDLENNDCRFIMTGCKRNPAKHDPGSVDREFREFIDSVIHGKSIEDWPSREPLKLLVSPSFSPADRSRLSRQGFAVLDIQDMADGKSPQPPAPQADAFADDSPEP